MIKAIMGSKKNSLNWVRDAVRRLDPKDKIKLAEDLDDETWENRFGKLVRKIRQKAKKSSISEREIKRACRRVRQRLSYG